MTEATLRLSSRQWSNYCRGVAGEVTRRLAARRESLILEHMPMTARIARSLAHMFAPWIEICDLEQAGYVGLVQAADRYRSEFGPFNRFAYFRVRGSIIDAHKRQAYREELHFSIDQWLEGEAVNGRPDQWEFLLAQIGRYLRDRSALPDELAMENQRRMRLAAAVAELQGDERRVLERALAGELAGAIAQSFGHSPNWARVRLHRARAKVAAALQGGK